MHHKCTTNAPYMHTPPFSDLTTNAPHCTIFIAYNVVKKSKKSEKSKIKR